ncbi:antibiotic biosynthesis monooxygenase [Tessaracoccus sp. MC1756]|uniref:antibiotic biosynthesis monooxygenase n=1 Tax=Tessaracoccus sp. MC1756 TaxID=2760311 RepID=UPI0015FF0039|nr:antibiotic biosynthesis monooxygenase [Tessaracoccus sp. MC1756]MBB1509023.1 antibiotic biosynthesis monooxygenase [Tessaracoccus sp. MC1756]
MYVFQVVVTIHPEAEEEFVAVTAANSAASLQEPGCLRFDVLQHDDDPTRFTLAEAYVDEGALDAHKQTDHYRAWAEVTNRVQTEPRVKQVFRALAGL